MCEHFTSGVKLDGKWLLLLQSMGFFGDGWVVKLSGSDFLRLTEMPDGKALCGRANSLR